MTAIPKGYRVVEVEVRVTIERIDSTGRTFVTATANNTPDAPDLDVEQLTWRALGRATREWNPQRPSRESAQPCGDAGMSAALTLDDVDQIAEGIEHFIIGIVDANPHVAAIWQPYIDQLKAQRSELAASHDLLVALKEAREELDLNGAVDMVQQIDAVIAKVEGRS